MNRNHVVADPETADVELRVMIWTQTKEIVHVVGAEVRAPKRTHMRSLRVLSPFESSQPDAADLTGEVVQLFDLARDRRVSDPACHNG